MIPAVLIAKKRDGISLETGEIREFIAGYASGEIADYQMSAMAMAITCRGMDEREIADLTSAMLDSGESLPRLGDTLRVDKHSTGGLGDKTSLILAPLLACFDLHVPMISGRGLGITGGTLDKLEAIEGYRTDLSIEESSEVLRQVGCTITGATATLVPADRKLYALRDVTGTVPSIALITASIMSKKLAESLDALVLDVKYGSGAFMRTRELGDQLADSLVRTGQRMGVKTTAILSDMNQPLGEMVGNACEVNESIDILRGVGPVDCTELTLRLAAEILLTTGIAADLSSALAALRAKIANGDAMERFLKMVAAHGGKLNPLSQGSHLELAPADVILAEHGGKLLSIDGQMLGSAIIELGGGRKVAGAKIDPTVGLKMHVRLGDRVERGDPIATLFSPPRLRETARRMVRYALGWGNEEEEG